MIKFRRNPIANHTTIRPIEVLTLGWGFLIVPFLGVCLFYTQFGLSGVVKEKKERITNGTISLMTLYPFVASIVFHGSHKCGGSIVSKMWILTAGHCCYFNGEEVPDTFMQISVGNVYWNDGKYYRVEKKFVHENYKAEKLINDIALLKTKTPIKFGLSVSPIPMYSNDISRNYGDEAVVMGWGLYTNSKGQLMSDASDELQHVKVKLVKLEQCKKYYSDITSKNLCVYGGDSKGSCQGDSGGPLVMNISKLVQIGVVSYGADCNNTIPEVYTSVYSFYSWIKDTMRKDRPAARKH